MEFIFDKIEERDVDFIVMRAFAELPGFLSLFLKKIDCSTGEVISIEHSFTDNELGESDITVIVLCENRKIGLLIENKIDAKAMPDQCFRYSQRGEKGICAGEYDDFAVFLIAPLEYIANNAEAKKYENHITYEELLAFFNSIHRPYDSDIIKAAIDKQSQGYIVQEVPSITAFWLKLYEYCSKSDKQIEMYAADGPKGARSTWPQFKLSLKGTALYYKSNQGVVDLQFSGRLNDSIRLKTELAKYIENDMHWVDTGASLSLRIKVKPMDFRQPFEQYGDELELMTEAVKRLTVFATKLNDIGYIV